MKWNYAKLQEESNKLGYDIRSELDLEIADLGKEGSVSHLKKFILNQADLESGLEKTKLRIH